MFLDPSRKESWKNKIAKSRALNFGKLQKLSKIDFYFIFVLKNITHILKYLPSFRPSPSISKMVQKNKTWTKVVEDLILYNIW